MSKSQHTEGQVIGALKQLEAAESGRCGAGGFGATVYAWKAKYDGIDMSHAPKVKQLRDDASEGNNLSRSAHSIRFSTADFLAAIPQRLPRKKGRREALVMLS